MASLKEYYAVPENRQKAAKAVAQHYIDNPDACQRQKQNAIKGCIASGKTAHEGSKLERLLRAEMEKLAIPFRVQVPIGTIVVVDIFLEAHRIIIEADGEYWHRNRKEQDAWQTAEYEKLGYIVFRFSEAEIKASPQRCIQRVLDHVTAHSHIVTR